MKRNSSEFDIIGVGSPVIDHLISKSKTTVFPGGPVSNTVIILSWLGLKVGLIGRIGNDQDGNILKNYLHKENVDISKLRIDKFPTTKSILKIAPNYSRFLSMKNYRSISKLEKSDLSYLKLSRAVFTLARGSLLKDVLSFAKQNIKMLFISLKNFHGEKDVSSLLKQNKTNLVLANQSEANKNKKLIKFLIKEKRLVAITKGKNGCIVYEHGNKKSYPPFNVKSIDPIGAGDSFAAGFIYGFLKSWNIDKIAYFANLIAALSTTEIGSTKRKITLDEAMKLLDTFYVG